MWHKVKRNFSISQSFGAHEKLKNLSDLQTWFSFSFSFPFPFHSMQCEKQQWAASKTGQIKKKRRPYMGLSAQPLCTWVYGSSSLWGVWSSSWYGAVYEAGAPGGTVATCGNFISTADTCCAPYLRICIFVSVSVICIKWLIFLRLISFSF